jgi:GH25 family lysozyme M1 (1,4-beta-N-acetylmuramidase)
MSEPTIVTDPEIPDGFRVFRAGQVDGEQAALVKLADGGRLSVASLATAPVAAAAAVNRTYLADVSEFQSNIIDAVYLKWSKAIIIRAAYGTRTDKAWFGGDRRAQLHKGGIRFLGIYQYLTAGQDPVVQAKALIKLIGKLQPGEKIICDLEEGSGNQHARLSAWYNTIESGLGDIPWTYSGLNFAATHGVAPVDWVAAYQSTEPSVPHKLWQFTDKLSIPGIGNIDASVFNGTIDQLAAYGHQAAITGGQFPIPAHLVAGTAGLVTLSVTWQPVKMTDGTQPTGYTVEAWGLDGKRYTSQVVTGTSCTMTGLHAGWTYKIRVWANGGKISPQHAEITVSV